MKILYIDPIFGISGDMMIGALINAGLPFEELEDLLKKVPLDLPAITPTLQTQGVIDGVHLVIENSDLHLSVAEMESVIAGLDIKETIRKNALGMLDIILMAESKIHGIGRDDLHLHELSHVDTIIDLLCVAKGIDFFEIEKVYCGPIPCGRGTIRTAHGIIPNPPPVTLEILSGYPLVFYDEPLELTTPTGATIVRHYVKGGITAPPFVAEKTGYGVGTYKTSRPDALRIYVGVCDGQSYDEEVQVIECDLDDMEMEYMGAVADRIRNTGALDVLYFPVFMKKGRQGVRLSVTVSRGALEHAVDTIFRETTTFGMRIKREGRRVLKRDEKIIETSYGPVRVKYGYDHNEKLLKTHIEFDDVKNIADSKGLSYRVALEMIKREIAVN